MIIRIAREANGLVIDIDGAGLAAPTIVLHDALPNDTAGAHGSSHGGSWKREARGKSSLGDRESAPDSGPLIGQPRPVRRRRMLRYLGTGATFALALIVGMVVRGGGSHAGAGPDLSALRIQEMPNLAPWRPARSKQHAVIEHGTSSNGEHWVREAWRSEKNAAVQPERPLAAAPSETEAGPPAEAAAVERYRSPPASAPPAGRVPKAITQALAAPPVIVPAPPEGRRSRLVDPASEPDAVPSSKAVSAPASPAALFGLQP